MTAEGEIAVVRYTARVAEGEDAGAVFDTTDADVARESDIYRENRDYEPLAFRVGDGTVLPGLDDAVRGMEVGEERTVEVDPERAFGERDDEKVVEMPRADLEAGRDATARPGELVRSETGETGWITGADGETATVDFNHELAGVAVEFDVTLLDRYED